ncbi:hypothetical protein Bca52824_011370 [Brassica carinata]|uniref:Uncharacterized protein n=1 Tax=Brassica carinata TaxID=52824 RepID=A0A8X8BBL2_BRACI|nr:hypothetical protein Bca52824_011370 [Brassica carinata]
MYPSIATLDIHGVEADPKDLRKLLMRRKRRHLRKPSSFHTLLSSSKRCTRADKGCQTDHTKCASVAAANPVIETPMDIPPPPSSTYAAVKISSVTPMDVPPSATSSDSANKKVVDDPPSNSPLVSQYGAQLYAQKECTHVGPEQTSDTVHDSPEHNRLSQHSSPVCNTLLQRGNQSNAQASPNHCSPLYDTSAAPLNLLDSPAPEPKSPTFQDILFRGVQIHSPISDDPITPTQPRYDSSSHTTSRRACLFPLSPLPFTPEHSPNKSSDSLSGFAPHAASLNAFSATATADPPVSPSPAPIEQVQTHHGGDVVELSDGSPPRRAFAHEPSMEENHVAEELLRCATVPAPELICPLEQTVWDLFQSTMSKFADAFHITPSNFAFSNKFLLELAVPMEWTRTYVSRIL